MPARHRAPPAAPHTAGSRPRTASGAVAGPPERAGTGATRRGPPAPVPPAPVEAAEAIGWKAPEASSPPARTPARAGPRGGSPFAPPRKRRCRAEESTAVSDPMRPPASHPRSRASLRTAVVWEVLQDALERRVKATGRESLDVLDTGGASPGAAVTVTDARVHTARRLGV